MIIGDSPVDLLARLTPSLMAREALLAKNRLINSLVGSERKACQ